MAGETAEPSRIAIDDLTEADMVNLLKASLHILDDNLYPGQKFGVRLLIASADGYAPQRDELRRKVQENPGWNANVQVYCEREHQGYTWSHMLVTYALHPEIFARGIVYESHLLQVPRTKVAGDSVKVQGRICYGNIGNEDWSPPQADSIEMIVSENRN